MQVSEEMIERALRAAPNFWRDTRNERKHIKKMIEAALAAMWRPAEEAPINRAVLIKTNVPDYYGNAGVYEAMLVDMGSGKRWHTFGYAVGRDIGGDFKPTHWTTLPQPPRHKEG